MGRRSELKRLGDQELSPVPGLLYPAEWCRQVESATVDLNGSRPQSPGKSQPLLLVAGPDRSGQSVPGAVGDLKGLSLIPVRDHRQHRSENLLLGDGHLRADVGEDGI